jgi:Protein of unknown function (DUF3891)
MIVKRQDGGWSLITQVDHAQHAGLIAEAWSQGLFRDGDVTDSLRHATAHHDLGWAEADREPTVDEHGAPSNFTAIDEARHTRFYAAAVRTIAQTDPGAAYLVSLHASGLYSRRYGWTGLKPVDWTKIGPDGHELLGSERQFRAELGAVMPPGAAEFEAAWRAYMLLETFDCLSLLTCLGVDCDACSPVPTLPGQWTTLAVDRLGPWEVALDPYPFAGSELVLEVPARHLDQERFADDAALRAALAATPLTLQRTVYRAA